MAKWEYEFYVTRTETVPIGEEIDSVSIHDKPIGDLEAKINERVFKVEGAESEDNGPKRYRFVEDKRRGGLGFFVLELSDYRRTEPAEADTYSIRCPWGNTWKMTKGIRGKITYEYAHTGAVTMGSLIEAIEKDVRAVYLQEKPREASGPQTESTNLLLENSNT